jgi:hypothetical protein
VFGKEGEEAKEWEGGEADEEQGWMKGRVEGRTREGGESGGGHSRTRSGLEG